MLRALLRAFVLETPLVPSDFIEGSLLVESLDEQLPALHLEVLQRRVKLREIRHRSSLSLSLLFS